MNANIKNLLWTTGAVILGLVVFGYVKPMLKKKGADADAADEE